MGPFFSRCRPYERWIAGFLVCVVEPAQPNRSTRKGIAVEVADPGPHRDVRPGPANGTPDERSLENTVHEVEVVAEPELLVGRAQCLLIFCPMPHFEHPAGLAELEERSIVLELGRVERRRWRLAGVAHGDHQCELSYPEQTGYQQRPQHVYAKRG